MMYKEWHQVIFHPITITPSEAHRSTPNDIKPKQKHNQPTVTNKEFHTSSNYDEIPIWVPFHIVDIVY